MTQPPPRLAFVGGGNMARSIIGGLLDAGHPAEYIAVGEPNDDARERLAALGPLLLPEDNADVVAGADLVVLAVKPQVMREVVSPLAGPLEEAGSVVMSIAAGIECAMLERWLGPRPIVRCMPNTPALVGAGATGLYATASVTDAGRRLAGAIMEAVGTVVWVEEEALLDAVIAVSGSGPAYYFLLMEKMVAAGVELGLEESTARALVLQTSLGAARMANESGVAPAELRRQVTSPGGTTAAAVAAFEDGAFGELVARAMGAAALRARELARELDA
ncbi:MAG: pyrroline-5-carboxylate reductase [Pseudomonadales bacterium]|jgi:pyrroline-5-carboxylate reductase|nr:pyrroline-5-carboxylate reductase [Pseudomonadales bacterium]